MHNQEKAKFIEFWSLGIRDALRNLNTMDLSILILSLDLCAHRGMWGVLHACVLLAVHHRYEG